MKNLDKRKLIAKECGWVRDAVNSPFKGIPPGKTGFKNRKKWPMYNSWNAVMEAAIEVCDKRDAEIFIAYIGGKVLAVMQFMGFNKPNWDDAVDSDDGPTAVFNAIVKFLEE